MNYIWLGKIYQIIISTMGVHLTALRAAPFKWSFSSVRERQGGAAALPNHLLFSPTESGHAERSEASFIDTLLPVIFYCLILLIGHSQ